MRNSIFHILYNTMEVVCIKHWKVMLLFPDLMVIFKASKIALILRDVFSQAKTNDYYCNLIGVQTKWFSFHLKPLVTSLQTTDLYFSGPFLIFKQNGIVTYLVE